VDKNKAGDNLPGPPPFKRQRNNSEQLSTSLTPGSNYSGDRDKDTPSLLVQALELNQSQSAQVRNTEIVFTEPYVCTNCSCVFDCQE